MVRKEVRQNELCSIKYFLDKFKEHKTSKKRLGHLLNVLQSYIEIKSSVQWVLNELQSVTLFFYYQNFEDFFPSFTGFVLFQLG